MTGTERDSDNKKDDEEEREQQMSEWMKVMLEEMDRKRIEHQEGAEELARRGGPGADAQDDALSDDTDDSSGER